MKPSEVLRAARAMVGVSNYESVIGSLKVAASDSPRALIEAIAALHRLLGASSVRTWFQTRARSHAEVLALFDRAIAAAEARGE